MLLSCHRLLWWRCYVVAAQVDAFALQWLTWRLVLAGSGSAVLRAPTFSDTCRIWSRDKPAARQVPPPLTFLWSYVEISTQSPLRRCTDVSQRRLLVWTRPIRNSARTVWPSQNTQRGRFDPLGNAAPLWTTSGTLRTHWEWTQFWTCPLRSRLGQTGFHPSAIHLTTFLWFVTSTLRRKSEKDVMDEDTGRDPAVRRQSRLAPDRLLSTWWRAEETPHLSERRWWR